MILLSWGFRLNLFQLICISKVMELVEVGVDIVSIVATVPYLVPFEVEHLLVVIVLARAASLHPTRHLVLARS